MVMAMMEALQQQQQQSQQSVVDQVQCRILDYLKDFPDEGLLLRASEQEARSPDSIGNVLAEAYSILRGSTLSQEDREYLQVKYKGCHIIRTLGYATKVPSPQLMSAFRFFHLYQKSSFALGHSCDMDILPALSIACLIVAGKAQDVAGKVDKLLGQMVKYWVADEWGGFPERTQIMEYEFYVLKCCKFDTHIDLPSDLVESTCWEAQVPHDVRSCVAQFFDTAEYQDSTLCLVEDPVAVVAALVVYVVQRRNIRLEHTEGKWEMPLDLLQRFSVDEKVIKSVLGLLARVIADGIDVPKCQHGSIPDLILMHE